MFSRISKVERINITIISFSSFFQIGDCQFIDGGNDVLAIQRRSDILHTDDKDFNDYPIFQSYPTFLPIVEPMVINTNQLQPFISVGAIKIKGISSSSVARIGNTDHIRMRNRVMHIRDISKKLSDVSTPPEGTIQL
ncbi:MULTISPECIES: spore germination protein GerPE [Bacillaceae]|uniref:Spore germination protein PE n=1 Tax=Peribacillus huizhouensis TaxID=1501239 RepID=A0ABR6CJI6_9BACI|nr:MULTISPECIES: spore germination protein GerPE [Bacillaceae]MBA9025234.1 spore germination protein PE [Peribacillus huizhouensis]